MWVIGAHVSDEKLAAILRIFDYVSFDTEAYVLAAYGLVGPHFLWEGEPYNSRILDAHGRRARGFANGTHVLFTLFRFAETNVFYFGDNALTRHSSGPLGRDAIIRPYRQDIFGDFTAQYATLTARYGRNLLWIRQNFFSAAIGGEIDIDLMWDWYIDELNDNGLQQFLELVEQFPVVGP